MADIRFPPVVGARGVGYWLRPANLIASRQKLFRLDYSNEWRYAFGEPEPQNRVVSMAKLLPPGKQISDGMRFIILGDTGEGDRSQYGLLPLLRALNPDFIIINGDVAYPAGRIGGRYEEDDFLLGFFQPYRNFRCAIWATPGNHEYYSDNRGRDFYDVFCTRKFDGLWSEHGLRHDTLQPGMYWELSDPGNESNLVVIGLDSGMSANLDGHNAWWQFWKRRIGPDSLQHSWLDARLRSAQQSGKTVILLFHIPALVKERYAAKYLNTIHAMLAAYPCVRLVLCAHEHNYQKYESSSFKDFLSDNILSGGGQPAGFPHYIVCGGGGAFLQSNGYNKGSYQAERFPSKEDWDEYANWGREVVSSLNMEKALLGRMIGIASQDWASDADAATFLSFILVEDKYLEGKRKVVVTPVHMKDLKLLFRNLPEEEIVDVSAERPILSTDEIKPCLQTPIILD